MDINNEWLKFLSTSKNNEFYDLEEEIIIDNSPNTSLNSNNIINNLENNIPKPSNLYISTKSKIAYLNKSIDLKKMFWSIKTIPYDSNDFGIIKKQIKYVFENREELENVQKMLNKERYYEEHVITSIDNPEGRIKFKDIRKITIGLSKKDILSYRTKKRGAFYNCFVIILRCKVDDIFKEYHIKVFNTGKLKIPGVQNDEIYKKILNYIVLILEPHMEEKLYYIKTSDTVLINSNFNCGFYINLEKLYDVLKYNYNIQSVFDPCSYPGIQCKIYYDNTKNIIIEREIKKKDIINDDEKIFKFTSDTKFQ